MSFIGDIIEDVVDLVVDVVETLIDLVVDVVEAVLDAAINLLGFDSGDRVVEYFEVYNQSLFSSSIVDNGLSQEMVASALYNNIDINSAIFYNAIFGDSIPKSLKQFVKYIDDGNYYTGFPEVESFLNYVDENEVTDVLNVIHSTPTSIDNAILGRLTIPTWIEWWLYTNKSYNLDTHTIGIYDIGYTAPTYNTATDDYTIPISWPSGTGTLPYNVPTKPVGVHIVANYHLDSAPTNRLLFKYKVGEGTYTELDDAETDLDLSSGTLKTLPAIPIRLNNNNYIGTSHETQITDLLAKVKLDGEGILHGITEDYGGPMSDLDHIYVNFGVRLVDVSQGGLQYLFRLFENLHSSNAVTEADYTAATGDKPYNNIIVIHDDYKYIFKYAFINFTHYSLSAVIADSDLKNIYYSKTNYFDSSNILIKPYYASSSQLMYKVQYQADNSTEVSSFLSGSGVLAPGTPTTEGLGKLQVTTRIAYSGTIYDSTGADSGQSVLKPDLVYENNSGLRIVLSVNEETTHSQEIVYYEIVANGLNTYRVKAPIGALNVIDADTGKFKLVKFNLANPDDLMLPFFYGAVPTVTAHNLSSMWLSSAHVSTYIARYEVIESNGGFLKLLLMIVIIVVVMIYTGYVDPSTWGAITKTTVVSGSTTTGTVLVTNSFGVVTTQTLVGGVVTSSSVAWGSTMMNFATKYITNQLIDYAIQTIAKDISPELAAVLSVFLQFKFGVGEGIDFSKALSLEDSLRISTIVVDLYSGIETINMDSQFEAEELIRQHFKTKLDTAYKDLTSAYADIEEFLNLGDHAIPGLNSDTRAYLVPEYPESFYIMALGTIEMSTHMYEFDYIMNQGYSFDLQNTYTV